MCRVSVHRSPVQRNVAGAQRFQVAFQLSVVAYGRVQFLRGAGGRRRDRRKSAEEILSVRTNNRLHSYGGRQGDVFDGGDKYTCRTRMTRPKRENKKAHSEVFVFAISAVHRCGVRSLRRRHGVPAVGSRVRILLRLSKRIFVQQSVRFVRETSRSHPRRRAQQSVQNDLFKPEEIERKRSRGLAVAGRRLV